MTTVDDDVKVWVAARSASLEKSEFSAQDVLDNLQRFFKADAKKLERFVTQQCVANSPGGAGKHYNYLFKLGPNRYRMFRTGDPIEYTHAGEPTSPTVGRVPEQYRSLFAAKQIHDAIRPAVPEKAEAAPRARSESSSRSRASAQQAVMEPASSKQPPTKGLMVNLAELDQNSPSALSRRTIFDMLFLEFGRLGSRLETKSGDRMIETFVIQHEKVTGTVKTLQSFTVLMPSGGLIAHESEIVIELESPARTFFIDILEASARIDEVKAHGYDSLHIRKDKKPRYQTLVFLRTPNGMQQDQAESICYAYDHFFGADANDAKNSNKFYALKSHILEWMSGKLRPATGG